MISKIPCGDVVTFNHALEGLLEKYGDRATNNIKNSYFSGNPCDLGGCCCHRPGEMMSTQGCEKRGGQVKKAHEQILAHYSDKKKESKNPLHMLAAVARDGAFKMKRSDTLAEFSAEPRRKGKFADKALDELRHLSDYKPAKTSRKKPKIVNMRSTFLYSAVEVDGKEVAPETVLGDETKSFAWSFPTASCLLTSMSMYEKEKREKGSGGPSELQPSSTKDLKDPEYLGGLLTALPVKKRKELKEKLTANRLANLPERQPGEDVVSYLYRRAHRESAENALDDLYLYDEEETKKKPAEKRIEEVVEEKLALDKEAGEMEDSACSARPAEASPKYQSKDFQIDGDGGVLEEAVSDMAASEEEEGSARETVRDRVRVKRELGDWIKTEYNYDAKKGGSICCDCERFNYWGYCQHCLYVEVVHLSKFPAGQAKEQWQLRHEKILYNLKVQCGYIR